MSDYNWIVPARELVRVYKIQSFPEEYAVVVKTAILNCFANIEHRANSGGDRYRTDPEYKKAVEFCYNSLYGVEEANGAFKADDEEYRKQMREFWKRLDLL